MAWAGGVREDPTPPAGSLGQERERLEEQLLQTQTLLQQREAELQALHKSCLVQLAHSSWVGRMLRSSTGSVEVSLRPWAHPPASYVPSPALLRLPHSQPACLVLVCAPWGTLACLPQPDSGWWTGTRRQPEPWGPAHLPLSKCIAPQVLVRSKGRDALPPTPARWPPVPLAGGDSRDPDGPQRIL